MTQKLTIDRARHMDFEQLITEVDRLIEEYSVPEGQVESEQQKIARLERTIDELPDVYRWILTLQSYYDHWTDAYAHQFGMKDNEYKQMRQRRDAMERAASAAKRRYEGASRMITLILGFQEDHMPRGRG